MDDRTANIADLLTRADELGCYIDTDNDGQIVVYTGVMYDSSKNIGTLFLDIVPFEAPA